MRRRKFLQMGTVAVGTIALSQCVRAPGTSVESSPIASAYRSQAGLLEVSLDARLTPQRLGDREATLLSYGGHIPGPLLEARPGDTVRLHFTNSLNAPTNLHYHGLHISPTGNADNPFLEIPPGDRYTYEFTLPADHHSVTAYYHPHLHGYVAQQIFGGLGGVFIVRGALDEHPLLQAAQEEIIFLKDFDPADTTSSSAEPLQGVQMPGREGTILTVNGQVNPAFSMTEGGLLRLRLVNASTSRFYRLVLEDHPLHLIATDSGSLAAPVTVEEVLLSPGERVEALVRGDRPAGTYRLLNLPYTRMGMGMGMGMGGMMRREPMGGRSPNPNAPQTLATFTYTGSVDPLPLPDTLVPVETLPEPQQTRRFTLNHGMTPGQGMMFLINGQAFDHHRIDTQVELDTIEEWDIQNTGAMDHPFHIHTNRFQIMSRNGQPASYPAWKDTVLIPVGETVRLRIPFRDYAGKTVYHCHILDHEDLGMMGTLEIHRPT
jgi:FtsP/CotA-like multicopper oxidase with cupredoxin domain